MTTIEEVIQNINYLFTNTTENPIDSLYFNVTDPNKYIKILSECKCCERHQRERPTCLYLWKDTHFNGTNLTAGECSCPCRHYARFICRVCWENPQKRSRL